MARHSEARSRVTFGFTNGEESLSLSKKSTKLAIFSKTAFDSINYNFATRKVRGLNSFERYRQIIRSTLTVICRWSVRPWTRASLRGAFLQILAAEVAEME